MICLVGNRPVIQVGRHQVVGYDNDWIREALTRAAHNSGRSDCPFINEILEGVIHYLENRCSLRLLPLNEFYDRVSHMLQKLRCEEMARALEPLAPPIVISLARAAREASEGLEMIFFQNLHNEVAELQSLGVEQFRFIDMKESVSILLGTKKWNVRSQQLANDIIDFVRAHKKTNMDRFELLVETMT